VFREALAVGTVEVEFQMNLPHRQLRAKPVSAVNYRQPETRRTQTFEHAIFAGNDLFVAMLESE
jgi:hypothetical protein